MSGITSATAATAAATSVGTAGVAMAGAGTAATLGGTLAAASPYITAGSGLLSIIGAANTAGALRQSGNIALEQAEIRQEQANETAAQLYENATETEAAGQRQGAEDLTRGDIAMGRAQAVMAASGAGVDPKLLAAIKGKANYNAAVDQWTASDKARVMDNEGLLTSWGGAVGLTQGEAEDVAAAQKGNAALLSGVAGTGLSLASKYGGPAPNSPGASTATAGTDPYLSLSPAGQVGEDVANEVA